MRHGIMISMEYKGSKVFPILVGRDFYFDTQSFFDVLGMRDDGRTDRDICDKYGIDLQEVEARDERHDKERRAVPVLSERAFEFLLMKISFSDYSEKKAFVDWYFDELLPYMDKAVNLLNSSNRFLNKQLIMDGGFRNYTSIEWMKTMRKIRRLMEEGHHES